MEEEKEVKKTEVKESKNLPQIVFEVNKKEIENKLREVRLDTAIKIYHNVVNY